MIPDPRAVVKRSIGRSVDNLLEQGYNPCAVSVGKGLIGETLGKYRIVEHLGHGGMAEVYKAYQESLDRYVAIKILHPFLAQEEGFLARFRREAKAVAALRHSNIIQVFDFDYDSERDIYYMVMEYIDGPSLKVRLRELAQRGERLPLAEIVHIAAAVADALDYAHRRGMVHRDVKPANVMFTGEGQVILTDFGIAKMVNVTGLTASGAMVGTPAYMAPEQGMGEAGDERSDIYSLGVMLYEMATGVLPFEADTPMGVVLKHINEPLPPPRSVRPDLPVALERVIIRALAKDPNQRYQTAAAMAADLRRVLVEEGRSSLEDTMAIAPMAQTMAVAPVAPPKAPSARPARRRRWWLLVPLAMVAVALVALLAIWMYGGHNLLPLSSAGMVSPSPSPIGSPTPNLPATEIAATMAAIQALLKTPTNTPSPTPSPTPDLTATAIAACEFGMEVVENPPVWPSVLAPGQTFTKRWVVRNSGTCPWQPDFRLVFLQGDQMGGPGVREVERVGAGETWEIALTLYAPEEYGTYTGVWQLQDGQGQPLGEGLEVTVRVGPTPTPLPPTATPTPEFTPTPVKPLEMSVPILIGGSCWVSDETGQWGGTLCWSASGGTGEYHYFYGNVSSEFELPSPCHDFQTRKDTKYLQVYYTTAGVGVFWPLPEGCCSGPSGYYRTPEGYEVVWQAVQVSQSDCQ